MRTLLIAAATAFLAVVAAAAAQTSRFGIPTTSVPYIGGVQLPTTLVGKLPICDRFHVGILQVTTDAATPVTFNTAPSGSGNLTVMVMCNGSAWVVQ